MLLVVDVIMEQLADGDIGLLVFDILEDVIFVYKKFLVRMDNHRICSKSNFLGVSTILLA